VHQVLLAGGNAIDAGVAVAAALGVVEPFMSGLGGGGWMQVHHAASGEHNTLDYCGRVPFAAAPGPGEGGLGGRLTPHSKSVGPLSSVVPGSPAGWLEMLRRYGTMSAAEAFAPAIELAEQGFPMTKRGADFFRANFEPGQRLSAERHPFAEVRRIFTHCGTRDYEFGELVSGRAGLSAPSAHARSLTNFYPPHVLSERFRIKRALHGHRRVASDCRFRNGEKASEPVWNLV
jgi:gamma-glutamyltranspeptidase